MIALQDIFVFSWQFFFNSSSCFNVLELWKKFESTLRGSSFFECVCNESSSINLNSIDLLFECWKSCFPLNIVLWIIDVILEGFQLAYLVFDSFSYLVDWFWRTSYCLKVVTKNCEKFLKNNTGFAEVFQDNLHVSGLVKNFLYSWEFPTSNSKFGLDVHFCFLVSVLPFLNYSNTLLDFFNRLTWWLFKNLLELNVAANLSTDLIWNWLKDVLKFSFCLIDVAWNSPN